MKNTDNISCFDKILKILSDDDDIISYLLKEEYDSETVKMDIIKDVNGSILNKYLKTKGKKEKFDKIKEICKGILIILTILF